MSISQIAVLMPMSYDKAMNYRRFLLRLWNLWPPFFCTGIRVMKKSPDFREIKVRLKLRWWSANYFGTQYGGSIFSMTDPFYAIMLIKNLGPDYIIWDKAAHVRFITPGRTDLFADFVISEEDLQHIKQMIQEEGRARWTKKVEVKNTHGELVAEVERTLSIKPKQPQS
jgi:acyl-coenzyme A thioesterase PaaI-like protein